jgi:outer membrane protein
MRLNITRTSIHSKLKLCLISLSLAGFAMHAQANPQAVTDAQGLIKAGKHAEAYAVLLPYEDELAEDAQYNYLLGISALDSKHLGKAVFALERATLIQPNNAEYRAELARVYFEMGEKNNAKAEFNQVLASNPPNAAKATINRYLSALEGTIEDKTRFNAHIQFGHGYDSNLNSATGTSTIAIPVFGGLVFDLNADAIKQSDHFNQVSLGAGFSHPLSNDFSVIGAFNHVERMNLDKVQFDTSTTNVNLGLAKRINQHKLSVSYDDSNLSVNQDHFRHAYGLNLQWQYDIDASKQLSVYSQLTRIAFSNETRDADRYLIGAGYAQAFNYDLRPIGFIGAYIGKEDARENNFDHVGFDFYGIRLGGQISINPKLDVYTNVSYEYRRHDARDPFFLLNRRDNQYDASLGLAYKPVASFSIVPSISYTNNDTNYSISDYERTVAMLNFRKNFDW